MFRLREDLYSEFPEKNSGSRPVSESSVTELVGSHRESVEAEKSNSSSEVQWSSTGCDYHIWELVNYKDLYMGAGGL